MIHGQAGVQDTVSLIAQYYNGCYSLRWNRWFKSFRSTNVSSAVSCRVTPMRMIKSFLMQSSEFSEFQSHVFEIRPTICVANGCRTSDDDMKANPWLEPWHIPVRPCIMLYYFNILITFVVIIQQYGPEKEDPIPEARTYPCAGW